MTAISKFEDGLVKKMMRELLDGLMDGDEWEGWV